MTERMRMTARCTGAPRWLPSLLVVSAACCFTTPSFADEAKVGSDALQSLLKACAARAETLKTFEGLVTMVEYANDDLPQPQRRWNWVEARTYAVDRTRGWSLCEQRIATGVDPDAAYTAHATVGDVWRTQDCSDGYWHEPPSHLRDYMRELMSHWLMVCELTDNAVSHMVNVVVTEEAAGEASCLHFELECLWGSGITTYDGIWLDPDKGSAPVKRRVVTLTDGKASRVSVYRAEELTHCTGDIWIPRRAEHVECVEGKSGWVWVTKAVREVVQARVNEGLSEEARSFFDPMPFTEGVCAAPWKQRLADDAEVEVPGPTGMTRVKVPDLLSELRDRLSEDIGHPQDIVNEALAEIPEALR